ncbi:ACP5, partial [Symbiodinium microadriaticum]
AYQYLRVSNACCVGNAGSCGASWDLYEVEVYGRSDGGINSKISPSVVSDSGVGKGRSASLAVNNNLEDWWEGDYDVGLSCSCWDESKVGGQWMVLDLGAPVPVSKIRIHQGGWGDEYAVSQVQLECSNTQNFVDPALRFEVSKETTTLECNSSSCEITECHGSSCSFASYCNASAGLSSTVLISSPFSLLAMVLALLM